MLIVTSNIWSVELEKISPADRDWITANSVHVSVTYQLWQDEPRVCATPGQKEYLPADEDLADFLGADEVATAPVDEFDEEDVFDFGCSNFDS